MRTTVITKTPLIRLKKERKKKKKGKKLDLFFDFVITASHIRDASRKFNTSTFRIIYRRTLIICKQKFVCCE